MKVIVDNEQIDVTLESENTVEEFLTSFTSQLNEMGRIVVKIVINGESFTNEMSTLNIDDNTKFEFESQDKIELMSGSLQYLIHNLTLLEKDLQEGESNLINNKYDFNLYFGDLEFQLSETIANFINKKIELYMKDKKAEDKQNLLTNLSPLKLSLYERYEEFINPFSQLEQTQKLLVDFKEKIEEIPLFFQSGKAKEALNRITYFTEIIEKFNRVLAALPEKTWGNELQDIEFVSILQELANAFENNDHVLIGDLMEYEITPKIDFLVTFIDSIKKRTTI